MWSSEPRSTAQSEHRHRSPLDSSDHLLRPSDFPPVQPGRDASTSQPPHDPIVSRHTGLMFSQDSARPENEQQQDVIPTPVGKGSDTPHCTGLPDTDIAAGDRPTEEADRKENTGTISDHQGSDVSANIANNNASETNDSSVTNEQRGLVLLVYTTCVPLATATLTWARVTVTYERAFTP